jgi:hypothetical protein
VPDRLIGVADQADAATTTDYRARERDPGGGTPAVEQYLIWTPERVVTYRGMAATPFGGSDAASTGEEAMLALVNGSTSTLVAVTAAMAAHEPAASATTTVTAAYRLSVETATAAAGAGTLTKVSLDTLGSTDAGIVIRSKWAADNGAPTAITGLTVPAPGAWSQYRWRAHTAVEQMLEGAWMDHALLGPVSLSPNSRASYRRPAGPLATDAPPAIVRPGQSFGMWVTNSTSRRHMAMIAWQEFTLP